MKSTKQSEVQALKEALKNFIEATEELNRSYAELKEEVKRLNEELSRQKNLLKAIVESINDGVVATDPQGVVIASNRKARELFNVKEGEKISSFLPQLEGELEFYTIEGTRKVITASNFPLIQDGRDIGRLIVLRDITRERELEEENKRKERLSAMGEMAVAIAHEIRNPLGSIELFAGLIKKEAKSQEAKKWAQSITQVVKSINNLISNMLIFTRPLFVEREETNLKEIAEECAKSASLALEEKGIELSIRGEASAWVDRELIKQALLNLIINAIQATPKGGKIEIELQKRGSEVLLRVTDTGCGIPKDVQKRIFDPFFTTKKKGTGLGLAIVHRIVEAHQGRIKVESSPGKTSFTITLPENAEIH